MFKFLKVMFLIVYIPFFVTLSYKFVWISYFITFITHLIIMTQSNFNIEKAKAALLFIINNVG